MEEVKIKGTIREHLDVVNALYETETSSIVHLCAEVLQCLKNGGKLLVMGNGGSAADSQHFVAEFVGRFLRERAPLPAIALSTDTSIITSIGNDFGFEYIFQRQIAALGRSEDLVVAISTSGNSRNVILGVEEAKQMQLRTIGLLGGNGGMLLDLVDLAVVVPSKVTARVQECHLLIYHMICEYCDEFFAKSN